MDPASKVLEMGRAEAHTHTHTHRDEVAHTTHTQRERTAGSWARTTHRRGSSRATHEQRGTSNEALTRNATQRTHALTHEPPRGPLHSCTRPHDEALTGALHRCGPCPCLQCTVCNAQVAMHSPLGTSDELRAQHGFSRSSQCQWPHTALHCTALPTRW